MLEVYTISEAETWDTIVRSFENYDVYYLSGYVKAFEIHGDGFPMLFYYADKKSSLRGINVVMKRDIAEDSRFTNKIKKDRWFDFVTPYGYGGWLIEGDGEHEKLFAAYEEWCQENNIVSEFVRYHPEIKNHKYSADFYDDMILGETIAMDITSQKVIWANLTSKNRNMIRKAKKAGIKIYHGCYPEIYEKFREIYNATMDKDRADGYYYFDSQFYESIIENLAQNAQIFYAKYENKVIAVSLILSANGKLNYHLSGSLREYQNLAPTNLLLYDAALWGSENGGKSFHLGGGVGACEDGLYKFKKAFNRGNPHSFHIGKKIYKNEEYQALVESRKFTDLKSGFFPKYRA